MKRPPGDPAVTDPDHSEVGLMVGLERLVREIETYLAFWDLARPTPEPGR